MLFALSFFLARAIAAAPILEHLTVVAGCELYTLNAQRVRTFPGDRCHFLPDGSVVSSGATQLRLIDPTGAIKWTLEGKYHHHLGLTHAGDRILALSSVQKKNAQGKLTRYDRALVVGLDGTVLHAIDLDEVLRLSKVEPLEYGNNLPADPGAEGEATHVNSFYEIPPLKTVLPSPWSTGNLLLNGSGHGVWILDPTLTKIVAFQRLPGTKFGAAHDVQLTPQGTLLFFNNYTEESTPLGRFSTIDELALPSLKKRAQFRSDPAVLFYSRYGGSVQPFDQDHWVFNTGFGGVYFYSKEQRKMLWSSVLFHAPENRVPRYLQKVTLQDLRAFLKLLK